MGIWLLNPFLEVSSFSDKAQDFIQPIVYRLRNNAAYALSWALERSPPSFCKWWEIVSRECHFYLDSFHKYYQSLVPWPHTFDFTEWVGSLSSRSDFEEGGVERLCGVAPLASPAPITHVWQIADAQESERWKDKSCSKQLFLLVFANAYKVFYILFAKEPANFKDHLQRTPNIAKEILVGSLGMFAEFNRSNISILSNNLRSNKSRRVSLGGGIKKSELYNKLDWYYLLLY